MADPKEDDVSTTGVPVRYKRSTPVRPAIWMTGVLVWPTVIALLFRVPTWAGIFLCGLTGLSFLAFLGAYVYLLATDRESLRREQISVKELPERLPVLLGKTSQPALPVPQPQGIATQPLGKVATLK